MKITTKIRFGIAIPALLSIVMAGSGVFGFLKINHQIETIYDDRVVPLRDLKAVSDEYAVSIIDAVNKTNEGIWSETQALTSIETAQSNIEKHWNQYRSTYLTPDEDRLATEVETLFTPLNREIANLIIALQNNDRVSIGRYDGDLYAFTDPLTMKLQELIDLQLNVAQQERGNARNIFNFVLTFYIVIIAAMAIAVMISLLMTVQLKQQIKKMIEATEYSSVQVTSSATEMSASGKQLEATMNEQVAATSAVSATSQEIASNAQNLVMTMEEVTELAQITASEASHGQENLLRMGDAMTQLLNATASISSRLGVMSEKAHNINNIVTTITKVADQTNLLSLNAAIEAEKAGEHGVGFAVVAREIRRLADQTAVSTLEIEQIVKEMQSAVSTGVMEMDKFSKEVSGNVEDVSIVSGQMAQVIDQVRTLTPRFALVSQGMEEQAKGAQQISGSMDQLSEASKQNAYSLGDTNTALSTLSDAVQSLRQEIILFKETV
jgi:methyl-accepting chemotaxis protein